MSGRGVAGPAIQLKEEGTEIDHRSTFYIAPFHGDDDTVYVLPLILAAYHDTNINFKA
jgi:hypothetical protein